MRTARVANPMPDRPGAHISAMREKGAFGLRPPIKMEGAHFMPNPRVDNIKKKL